MTRMPLQLFTRWSVILPIGWFQQFYLNVIHPEGPAFQALFEIKIRMASATFSTHAGFNE